MTEPPALPVDPRIYLAAERTFLAWIRTGIAFMGFGFVVARFGLFLHEILLDGRAARDEPSFSLPVGISLMAAGVLISVGAALRHRGYVQALDRGQLTPSRGAGFIFLIAGFLAAIGLVVAISLGFLL